MGNQLIDTQKTAENADKISTFGILSVRRGKRSKEYNHWYPVIEVMLGTGMRVGEAVGLRWCDIDFEKR